MSEAARWRTQLRETETQRDQLAAAADTLITQTVEDMLTRTGVTLAAVLKITELPALCDDAGVPDAALVAAAVQTARDRFGITPTPKGNLVPGVGNQPGAVPRGDLFTDAFRRR